MQPPLHHFLEKEPYIKSKYLYNTILIELYGWRTCQVSSLILSNPAGVITSGLYVHVLNQKLLKQLSHPEATQ